MMHNSTRQIIIMRVVTDIFPNGHTQTSPMVSIYEDGREVEGTCIDYGTQCPWTDEQILLDYAAAKGYAEQAQAWVDWCKREHYPLYTIPIDKSAEQLRWHDYREEDRMLAREQELRSAAEMDIREYKQRGIML